MESNHTSIGGQKAPETALLRDGSQSSGEASGQGRLGMKEGTEGNTMADGSATASATASFSSSTSSSAATLLMAASSFAQTSAQSVSKALLGQVHAAAAAAEASGSPLSIAFTSSSPSSASILSRSVVAQNASASPLDSTPIDSSAASSSSSKQRLPPRLPHHQSLAPVPESPRSAAKLVVGDIATRAAASEYVQQAFSVKQVTNSSLGVSNSDQGRKYEGQGSAIGLGIGTGGRYDAANPFQGVPSMPLMPSASLAMLPPDFEGAPEAMRATFTPMWTRHASAKGVERAFQPVYRLAPDEYQILASAAAVATVALTTATDPGGQDSNLPDSTTSATARRSNAGDSQKSDEDTAVPIAKSQRILTSKEQEHIAGVLRAWAGLEGPQRQADARQELQQRQKRVVLQASNGAQVVGNGDTTLQQESLFPPDVARHYQSQLTALAEGYYTELHKDAFNSPPSLPASSRQQSGNRSRAHLDQLAQQSQRQLQRQQKEQLQKQKLAPLAAEDPAVLLSTVSSTSGLDVHSPELRDQMLQYAHGLYSTGSTTETVQMSPEEAAAAGDNATEASKQTKTKVKLHPTLLPLLQTLRDLHPKHKPTLLLLSCAYYSAGDLAASLMYNNEILKLDPNYVESMSNIGTTLRALNKWNEAESWWWRAIRIRPGYWDAYENLLGVLSSPQQMPQTDEQKAANDRAAELGIAPESAMQKSTEQPQVGKVRFAEALKLCDFVEAHVMAAGKDKASAGGSGETGDSGEDSDEVRPRKVAGGGDHPVWMPSSLPVPQAWRLQNLFYAKGNLRYVLGDAGAVPAAAREYQKAIEISISASEKSAYSLKDLVIATYAAAILTLKTTLPGTDPAILVVDVSRAIGLDVHDPMHAQAMATGKFTSLSSGGLLRLVRDSGDNIVKLLLRLGNGNLPTLMLLPDLAIKLRDVVFAETDGQLPALVINAHLQGAKKNPTGFEQACQTTSTILLTLAKLFQDATAVAPAAAGDGAHNSLTLGGIPPSLALMFPLYYLSFSLNPTASTANNVGILLSSLSLVTQVVSLNGQRQSINGQTLAMQYYTHGLNLDAKHPHLYTNLGSLFKDLGKLNEAIQMYEKAVEYSPNFDVALANLGNAIKDQGRQHDAIQYYRRAVEINPKFPEALCGLVNSLLAVCDWREVYPENDASWSGWMSEVKDLIQKQLDEGTHYGAGALAVEGSAYDWAKLVAVATGDMRQTTLDSLLQRFQSFYQPLDRQTLKINEGSFVIRLVERLLRRSQRRWYLDRFGKVIQQAAQPMAETMLSIRPVAEDVQRYPRVPIPSCLITPNVPTVLPFHTFTLKIPPRHIRLISHRNALRISQATLTQMWLPPHVYPPPPPPSPKLRIGYVSSDFNNHPLAHLMQSVFGFHDLDRFEVFLYATTASDHSPYRQTIEAGAQHFIDVSTWTNQAIINRILDDGIHVLMNLNGYTKGAKNEVFAARPCPVQMEFMGFAGGLASGWTDWIVADPIVCPPDQTSVDQWRAKRRLAQAPLPRPTEFHGDMDPEEPSDEWIYTERFIYMPHSYFVNDHAQGFREPEERRAIDGQLIKPSDLTENEAWAEEEERRWKARKELWPNLPDDFVIFSDFNQLYKFEPELFKLWLRILKRVPRSILWLLRFPAAGEAHLLRAAKEWAGEEVASRVIFTEVAPKGVHIHRGRIADLFLDSLECNAHTTSADILWSGTPVLTWPKHRYKMASRVAASIVNATGLGEKLIVGSEQEYEERAVELATGLSYIYRNGKGEELRPIEAHGNVTAKAFKFNPASSSALPHSAQHQQQPTTSSSSSKTSSSASQANLEADKYSAPAPANVGQAAAVSSSSSMAAAEEEKPAIDSVVLVNRGEPQGPTDASTRNGQGELSDLRKVLFLTRDKSALFDTRGWTRALERGYEEAWKRFVGGTDNEEGPEWEALPEDAPEKRSGHIWLTAADAGRTDSYATEKAL